MDTPTAGHPVLDDPARLAVFDGALLSRELDAPLQALLQVAVNMSGCPIALVTLVLKDMQFFRGHVGLAEDDGLFYAQGTARCSAFCALVVANKAPLEVLDAKGAAGIPQDLVVRYGIRFYLGVPLFVDGHPVGSLCVIDTKPRPKSTSLLPVLQRLAQEAEKRLNHLAAGEPSPELRRLSRRVGQSTQQARLAALEAGAFARLGGALAAKRITPEEFEKTREALALMRALTQAE